MTEDISKYLSVAIYRIIHTNGIVIVIIKVFLWPEKTMQKTNMFSNDINLLHMPHVAILAFWCHFTLCGDLNSKSGELKTNTNKKKTFVLQHV